MTGKIARTSLLWAYCVGILLGAVALLWAPTAEAQGAFFLPPQAQLSQPAKINRKQPGLRTGVLTTAKGGTVRIDSFQYKLAPGALIEDTRGNPVPLLEFVWEGVEVPAQYWLGHGATENQIIQIILTFAE